MSFYWVMFFFVTIIVSTNGMIHIMDFLMNDNIRVIIPYINRYPSNILLNNDLYKLKKCEWFEFNDKWFEFNNKWFESNDKWFESNNKCFYQNKNSNIVFV